MPTPEAREQREQDNRRFRARIDHLLSVYRFVAVALTIGSLVLAGTVALGFVRMGQVVADQQAAQDRLRVVVADVQAERLRNVRVACQAQNERHDATVRTLDARLALAAAHLPPSRRRQLQESRDFTVALIGALAPKRPDCDAYAREQVAASPRG